MSYALSYRRAALPLSSLLAGAVLLKFLLSAYSMPVAIPQNWRVNFCHDAESSLAVGDRLDLGKVDIYSLELIKGVSDTLAIKILESRESIYRIAAYLRPGERHRALEVIRGIGIKTAQKLSHSIDPDSQLPPESDERSSIYTAHD